MEKDLECIGKDFALYSVDNGEPLKVSGGRVTQFHLNKVTVTAVLRWNGGIWSRGSKTMAFTPTLT